VFTDLNKEDVSGGEGRIWLVCNVVGDGNYQELTKCSSLSFPSVAFVSMRIQVQQYVKADPRF
jgi:hypothetical protein